MTIKVKLANVQDAIIRLKAIIESHENLFVKHVGIADIQDKKKAKGYHEYLLEDGIKLAYLQNLESRLKSWIKQEEDVSKPNTKVS